MRDYWFTLSLLQVIGWGYALLFLLALALALWLPKKRLKKFIYTTLVLGLGLILPIRSYLETQEQKSQQTVFLEKQAKARALFNERCKTAGEKIYRTVDGVDGVLLAKRRPDYQGQSDQYTMNDPYGRDSGGEGYALNMLLGRNHENRLSPVATESLGYRYVVMINADGLTYTRFEADETRDADGRLIVKKSAADELPRYAVTYEDISTRGDRDYWVAGSRLTIFDRDEDKVLAERIGWMMDLGQGAGAAQGLRSPWGYAAYNACPAFQKIHRQYPMQTGQTRSFVEKVLKPE